jgi:hypothetical protein
MDSQSPPKGSLEELFRHHLLESEAAAVPPRPLVWEHIDNSLLLAQNEKYRRRLLAYRWGMAASLLLAALGGGGWWHSHQATPDTLASAHPQGNAAQLAVANATLASRRALPLASEPASTGQDLASSSSSTSSAALTGTSRSLATSGAGYGSAGLAAATQPTPGSQSATSARAGGQRALLDGSDSHSLAVQRGVGAARWAAATTHVHAHSAAFSSTATAEPIGTTVTSLSASSFGTLAAGPGGSPGEVAGGVGFAELPSASALPLATQLALATDGRAGEDLLAANQVPLALASADALPTNLALRELTPLSATELRRWRFGVEYAASAFNPNIDFNSSAAPSNPTPSFSTIGITRTAAAEYRANLRAGLGQRLGLRATRWLGGHWSLSSGVEVAQQEAYSATTSGFAGQPQSAVNNFTIPPTAYVPRELRTSSYRYRSAGVPVELRYDNQAKAGVSFYGRVGAIVSALLSVRSEVASNPEATRSYSFFSASTPYRRLTTLLRGSAGVRYRPANSTWGVSVGPTAEAGVQSLNTETDQPFLQQSRPYSFGLEAGFEFGGTLKPVEAGMR